MSATAVSGMLRVDALRLLRDRFLVGMSLYVLLVALALRWALPWVGAELMARWRFDLAPWFPLLVSYFAVVMASVLVGMIGGFLLLEAREERTVRALLVAPVPLATYLLVVGTVLALFGFTLALMQALLIGIALPPWPALLGSCLAIAPAAPLVAFYVAAQSSNKVEAFAQMKILGTLGLAPIGAWFVPEPWQWLCGLYPPYWAVKAYWVANAGSSAWPLWVLGGVLTSLGATFVAARRYATAVRR